MWTYTGDGRDGDGLVDTSGIDSIRMGTTVATNALLEREGARTCLVTTKGFKDLLFIGNQSRPKIFDLEINTPEVLYERVVEVDERVLLAANDGEQGSGGLEVATGVTGESVYVEKSPDPAKVRAALEPVLQCGIKSLAVVLMHSFTFSRHEHVIGKIAREMGFTQISLSSEVMPMVKMVPRGYTACADAYLTPCILEYVSSFKSGLFFR